MTPSLEDMQVFCTVVDAGSFTKAALQLDRTKSAISQSVSRLEVNLGVQLLYRSTRSLSLTEMGRDFYRHCCDIRSSYDRALEAVKEAVKEAEPVGHLTIAAPQALTQAFVVPALSDLLQTHPRLEVTLLADDNPADLIEGQIDVAIRVGRLQHQTAKVRRLGDLTEGLYASREYLESFQYQSISPEEIQHAQFIGQQWQGRRLDYQAQDGQGFTVTPKLRCNSVHDALALALNHQGLARLPDSFVDSSPMAESLVRVVGVAKTPIYSMHFFAKSAPKKVQVFLQYLKRYLIT